MIRVIINKNYLVTRLHCTAQLTMLTTLTAALLATVFAAQASALNGIWTGHDWTDGVNGIKDVNGLLSGTTSEMIRHL